MLHSKTSNFEAYALEFDSSYCGWFRKCT